ncbi:MAG: hypothetical protein Q7U26_18290, partial [Aquabacterium sp.]|nr:hypothetical protein [Aquabacterium sp.]
MKNKLIVFLIAAVALMVLPLIAQSAGNFWVRMLDFALLYVLLALGLNIVVGYAGLLDLGYVAFYAVGAYMFGLMASPHLAENFAMFKAAFPQGLHSPVWLVIPLGAGLAGLAGMLLGARNLAPALRFVAELDPAAPDMDRKVEDGKKTFAGFELAGHTLGIVGL